jgi:chromate reductase
MGGEAYIGFRPDLIDESDSINDASTRAFLQSFAERFATLAGQLRDTDRAIAA